MKKFIYIIIIIFLVIRCKPSNEWKKYSIKEENYFASGTHIYFHKSDTLEFMFKFDNTAVYEIGHSQINKLYGLCPGINVMHESYRFGWKCVDEKIEIYALIHDNGSTISKYFGNIEINSVNSAKIELVDSGGYFTLNDKMEFIKFNTKLKDSYLILLPYFGGKIPAPHQIDIFIKQLN
jgi:GH15 family glucan-1,4-alpha-glucosidase